jgi:hypothetical protein
LDEHRDIALIVGGAILGLILGLIFAYWIAPVNWEDASPGQLHPIYQQYYVNGVAQEYVRTGDLAMAEYKLGLNLEEDQNPWLENPETLQAAFEEALAQAGTADEAMAVGRLAQDLGIEITPPIPAETPETEVPIVEGEEEEGTTASILQILGFLLLVLAMVGAGFLLFTRLNARRRERVAGEGTVAGAYGEIIEEEEVFVDVEGETTAPPLKSFVATYVLGDDFFDPSFSIEVENDFLGECGVGISESIGVGDPKKVTALEAWLFDKSDIRTVTTVLASEYAYEDPSLNSKLAAKGEIVEVAPGQEILLETTALRVEVRVKEVEYAQSEALPEDSYFQKVSLELRAWLKPGSEATL